MKIKLTVDIPRITYSIENATYITGESRDNGNNDYFKMQVDSEEKSSGNFIKTAIENALSDATSLLAEYLPSVEDINGKKVFTLNMPDNFNVSVQNTVQDNINDMIVNKAISDWYAMTNRDEAGEYLSKAETDKVQIVIDLRKRVRPRRNW